jgi:Fe2+ transport system protein FeoA
MVKIVGNETAFATAPALEEGVALNSLRPGQSGVILRIDADASGAPAPAVSAAASLKMHLLELGFVAGSSITFLMNTPFGDPGIYSLRGTSIALRKSEARCIRVKI